MDPQILVAIFTFFTALGFWAPVPYTPINPGNPLSTRLLGAIQATAASYGAVSILGGLLPDHSVFQFPVAHAGATMEPIITAEGSSYPTATSSMVMPSASTHHESFHSTEQDPKWILHTLFVLARDEFWRSPNLYTVVVAILVSFWFTTTPLSDRRATGQIKRVEAELDLERTKNSVRIDELSNNFRALDERLHGLIATVSALPHKTTQFDALPAELGQFKGRFELLLPDFRALQSDVKHLTSLTSALQQRNESTEAQVSSVNNEVVALRRDVRAVQECTTAENKRLDSSLAGLNARIAALREAESSSASKPTTAAGAVETSTSLEAEQKILRSKIEHTDYLLSSLTTEVRHLKESAVADRERIQDLTSRADMAAPVVEKMPWKEHTQDLKKSLKDLGVDVQSIKDDYVTADERDDLKNKFEDLSAKYQRLQSNLKSFADSWATKKDLDSAMQPIKDTYATRAAHQGLQDEIRKVVDKQRELSAEENGNRVKRRLDGLDEAMTRVMDDYVPKSEAKALSDEVKRVSSKLHAFSGAQSTDPPVSWLHNLEQDVTEIKQQYVTKSDHQALSDALDNVSRTQKRLADWKNEASKESHSLSSRVQKLFDNQPEIAPHSKTLQDLSNAVHNLQTGTASAEEVKTLRDDLTRSLPASEERIKSLRREHETHAQSMKDLTDKLGQDVQLIRDKVKNVDDDFCTFKSDLNKIGINDVHAQLKEVREFMPQVADLKISVAACERNVETVESNMSRWETTLASADSGLSAAELNRLKDTVSTYATDLSELKKEVSDLQLTQSSADVSPSAMEFAELKDKLSKYATSLEDIEKTVSQLQSTPVKDDSSLTKEDFDNLLKDKLSMYKTSLDEVRKKIIELQWAGATGGGSDIGATEFKALKSEMAAYNTSLEELKKKVSDLQAAPASGDDSMSAMELAELRNRVSTCAASLEEVKKKVSDLESAAPAVSKEWVEDTTKTLKYAREMAGDADIRSMSNADDLYYQKRSVIPSIQEALNRTRWGLQLREKETKALAEHVKLELPQAGVMPEGFGADLYYPRHEMHDAATPKGPGSEGQQVQGEAEDTAKPKPQNDPLTRENLRDSDIFKSRWAPTGEEKEKVIQETDAALAAEEEERRKRQQQRREGRGGSASSRGSSSGRRGAR